MEDVKLIKKVVYRGEEYFLYLTKYANNGRPALVLDKREDFIGSYESVVLSVNLSDEPLDENEIAIQDHDYYAGNLKFLEEEGIVRFAGWFGLSGFVAYPICELLVSPENT